MATINGFHPPMSTLHSQTTKPQVPHATLHSLQLTSHQPHPMLAYQRSSFTKFPYAHQLIRAHHRLLITKVTQASEKSPPETQGPADKSPLSTWQNWIVGLLLSIIIPSLRHKWGPLLALKSKVDMAVDTVESVTEVVEELAEEVEKVAEQIEDKLPEDAKLKQAMDSIEHLAEDAVKKAEQAKDVIHKVEEVEEEIEKALITGSDVDSVKGEGEKKS
ncbi:uncharacterized protein Pyn_16713 [Prunus yedoensis var. nudiflora]|uniref:Uncharacterized protein n=1 Tax=Prunus yedoensis var. nudiflora TaxID=2094558 RepID=A0A314Z5B2_PRUYE|nr:uncharacterized protein Pyn_16713 [Prunus yedoensis var. nudiflora]